MGYIKEMLLENTQEVLATACYLPTEEELYLTYPNKKDDNLIDIRLLKDNLDIVLSPYKIINPKYELILTGNLFLNKEIYSNDMALYHAIKNIVDFSFDVPSKEQELIKILTKTENKVLKNILEDFNNSNEGDIKVSLATEKYNISTSVFRTLFYKLKEYNVATVDSRGVKGTHIKFNNIENLKTLID